MHRVPRLPAPFGHRGAEVEIHLVQHHRGGDAVRFREDEPDLRGFYGASLLFVRWSPGGERPEGHVETDRLAWGRTPEEATERVGALSLYDVKAALDEAIARAPGAW